MDENLLENSILETGKKDISEFMDDT